MTSDTDMTDSCFSYAREYLEFRNTISYHITNSRVSNFEVSKRSKYVCRKKIRAC